MKLANRNNSPEFLVSSNKYNPLYTWRKLVVTRTLLCLVLLVISCAVRAQQQQQPSKITLLARPLKDSVMLRWGPTNPQAWYILNKSGYHIRRFTITRDGKLLAKPEQLLLTTQPIKPLPLPAWQKKVEAEDKYFSIAAQALYGESFEVSETEEKGISKMLNQAKEKESRYSFALFSADLDFEVAKAMGLAYIDYAVKSNEKYLYRIYAATADKNTKIDTGFVYTGYADFKPLPKPFELKVDAEKKGVMISWNQEAFKGIFTTYVVERSEDNGQTFISISDAGVVNPEQSETKENRRAFKLDTISAVDKKLVYRVKGISPFGEVGPSSDTVSVMAIHQLEVAAIISNAEVIGKTVKVTWEMPAQPAEIIGFDIEKSNNPNKGFKKINIKLLAPNSRTYTDQTTTNSNYYRVKAYGKENRATLSYPAFAQLVDSIPPTAPIELNGTADKTGLVKLNWKANTEKDLAGYRVYRGNAENGEFSQVSRKTVKTNFFTDTIELKTLTKAVYYKLVAVDTRFNPSEFSIPFKLKRPDIVPPSPPSFYEVNSAAEGIHLAWYASTSDDVVKHELYRTKKGEENWKAIASFKDTSHVFIDTTAQLSQEYSYKLTAFDESNLSSDSKSFSAIRIDLGLKPAILNASVVADRENQQVILQWKYIVPKVDSYLIYRAEQGKPWRLYQTLKPTLTIQKDKSHQFIDKQLFINTIYQYRIKAVFTDGTETPFSKAITINY